MIPYMGWILLGYGLAAVLVHVFHSRYLRSKRKGNKQIHYILVTHNHENQMEWYLRALSWYARLRGESLRVTVLDEGSQDDTLAIMQRMQNMSGMDLTVIGITEVQDEVEMRAVTSPDGGENSMYIDLRVPQEAAKIPYVHV
ncbi:hypothetical protein [Paenibacillus sp. FSL K6-2524]|uniref:hypothetical protein n=1 Tax=Paenibacillus sp. FSL K6-2524 TaxID=2954516 RepID=UPI0030F9FC13